MNEKPSKSSDEMYEGDSVGDDAYVNTASNLNNGEGDPVIQNPYYEGEMAITAQDGSKPNVIPDFNAVEAVTKVDNIYYEI